MGKRGEDKGDVRSLLRRASSSRKPVRENLDNLVGAIVEATLAALAGVPLDLTQDFVLRFGRDVFIRFRDIGIVPVSSDRAAYQLRKYTVSQNVIEISGMYFELFYNADHVVIHRHAGYSYRFLMKEIDEPLRPPVGAPEDTKRKTINLSLEFDSVLKRRMEYCASWEGLTLEEWAVAAFRKYVAATPEPEHMEFPTTAPGGEFYRERKDRSEKAPAFIKRVYGHLLNGDFLRSDLRKLDEPAEMALRNWERLHGRCGLNIPTKKQRNDKIVAEGRLLADDPMETMRRIAAAAYRRR